MTIHFTYYPIHLGIIRIILDLYYLVRLFQAPFIIFSSKVQKFFDTVSRELRHTVYSATTASSSFKEVVPSKLEEEKDGISLDVLHSKLLLRMPKMLL